MNHPGNTDKWQVIILNVLISQCANVQMTNSKCPTGKDGYEIREGML
jgi:hypothetical protein